MGFYELKKSSLPTIPWREYTGEEDFGKGRLWTIRTAVYSGNDLNLPRFVGVKHDEAKIQAEYLFRKYHSDGMVLYYPFFIAEKSGTLNVFSDKVVIEAVKDDLWNLVTYSDREVTIIKRGENQDVIGNTEFLTENEQEELNRYVPVVKSMFREMFLEGKSVLLEWSYAYECDEDRNRVGNRYLVFYEARTV